MQLKGMNRSSAEHILNKIDVDGNGAVHEGEFVTYFQNYLPANRMKFDSIMDSMIELAEELRAENPHLSRQERLKAVYQMFDIDNNGTVCSLPHCCRPAVSSLSQAFVPAQVDKEELMRLGRARRKIGHKTDKWTAEQNET